MDGASSTLLAPDPATSPSSDASYPPASPTHHLPNSSFHNPWIAPAVENATGAGIAANSWAKLSQTVLNTKFPFEWAKALHNDKHPVQPVKVVKPNFGRETEGAEGLIKATWLGHASYLLEMPVSSPNAKPTRILFDPIFSLRASPTPYIGVTRRLPPPCTVEELPEFHFVAISHNHYDHLDYPTVDSIHKLRGSLVHYIVPLGNKSWFESCNIPSSQITELDWWQEASFELPSAPSPVKFVCTPAQHTSGRGIQDQRSTLWSGWIVESSVSPPPSARNRVAVYYAGDTGYSTPTGPAPIFTQIGEKYGPFDLSLIPIWRGGTLAFVASLGLRILPHPLIPTHITHASPQEALKLHVDVRSLHSLGATNPPFFLLYPSAQSNVVYAIGMHFATFAGSDVEALEPLLELENAKARMRLGLGGSHKEDTKQVGGTDKGKGKAADEGEWGKGKDGWMINAGFGWLDIGETATLRVGARVSLPGGGG